MSQAELVCLVGLITILACAPSDPGFVAGQERGRSGQGAVPVQQHAEAAAGPRIVTPRGEIILLEIARTDQQRARGLMFRESLPENHGMLFVFAESERHGFWMKNTFIPLDMLWIAEDGTIAAIIRDVPPCHSDPCPTYAPDAPGSFVLEIGAGEAKRLGLGEGDRLELRNIEPPTGG